MLQGGFLNSISLCHIGKILWLQNGSEFHKPELTIRKRLKRYKEWSTLTVLKDMFFAVVVSTLKSLRCLKPKGLLLHGSALAPGE